MNCKHLKSHKAKTVRTEKNEIYRLRIYFQNLGEKKVGAVVSDRTIFKKLTNLEFLFPVVVNISQVRRKVLLKAL